ncbi:hypothetical protein GCM10027563_28550 [Parasphingorhabdus pacifica]
MYEMMIGWETDPSVATQSPESAEFAEIWQAAEKIVYSTTLSAISTRRTRLERRFEAAEVEEVKRRSPADLYVDGPTLAAHAIRGLGKSREKLNAKHLIAGQRAYPSGPRWRVRYTVGRETGNSSVRSVIV